MAKRSEKPARPPKRTPGSWRDRLRAVLLDLAFKVTSYALFVLAKQFIEARFE
jgi:hypothetical protein